MVNSLQKRAVGLTEIASLQRRSALQSIYETKTLHRKAAETVILSERRGLGIVQLQGPASNFQFTETVHRHLGVALPLITNEVVCEEDYTILALGPGRWFVVAPISQASGLERELRTAVNGHFSAVTDLSHGWSVIRISGNACRDLLAKLCSIDLHPRAFIQGSCAQTELRGLLTIVHAVDAEQFDLYVMRSFAASVWSWLQDAAAEFSCRIEATVE